MSSGWILPVHYPNAHFSLTQFLLITLMATFSLSRSIHFQPVCLIKPYLRRPHFPSYPHHSLKSRPCPLWSSSFSLCLLHTRSRTHRHSLLRKAIGAKPARTSSPYVRSFSISASSVVPEMADTESNPLLKEFYFPPFDSIEAEHVRPGVRALLKQLVCLLFIGFIQSELNAGINWIGWICRNVIWRNWKRRRSHHGRSWWSRWRGLLIGSQWCGVLFHIWRPSKIMLTFDPPLKKSRYINSLRIHVDLCSIICVGWFSCWVFVHGFNLMWCVL